MIKRGRDWDKYGNKIIETLENFNLSEHFHWTPNQIREIDESDRFAYIAIMVGMHEARNEKKKK